MMPPDREYTLPEAWSDAGTSAEPVYSKQRHDGRSNFWRLVVDEGWRTWILCDHMYEWAADDLLARLREHNRPWKGVPVDYPHGMDT